MIKNIIKVLSTDLLIKVFVFTAGVLVARALGAELRGELAIIISVMQLITFIAILGLDEAIIYYAKEGRIKFSHTLFLKLSLFLGTIFYIIGYFFIDVFYNTINNFAYVYLLIVFIAIFIALMHSTILGTKYYTIFNFSKLVQNLVYTFAICTLYLLDVLTIKSVLIVLMLSALVNLIYTYFKTKSLAIFKNSIKISTLEFIRSLNPYALQIFIYSVSGAVMAQLPILYLGTFISTAELGPFSVQLNLIYLLINIVSSALFVLMVEGSEDFKINKFFIFYFLFFLGLLFFDFVVADYFFVFVYGEEYKMSSHFFRLMTTGTFFWMGENILNSVLKGIGKVKIVMWITSSILLVFIIQLAIGEKSINTLITAYNISHFIGFITTLLIYLKIKSRQERYR
jgi:O-antigen/teichoic acid export membrane protein